MRTQRLKFGEGAHSSGASTPRELDCRLDAEMTIRSAQLFARIPARLDERKGNCSARKFDTETDGQRD